MKRCVLFVLFVCMILLASMLYAEVLSPVAPASISYPCIGDAEVDVPDNIPPFLPADNELDMMGDTIIVGYTYWESQHNGTIGHMIGWDNDSETASMIWTCLESGAEASTRHVRFNRIDFSGGTPSVEVASGSIVDANERAGYATLPFHDGIALPVYHYRGGNQETYHPVCAAEWTVFPGVFNETIMPQYEDLIWWWPHGAYAEYNDEHILHMVATEWREDNAGLQQVIYVRNQFDTENERIIAGDWETVTEYGMNISADIGASNDGARVAIAATVSRDYLYHPEDDPTQYNNDLWLWISEDGGETWDWENPIDITDFAMPNPDMFPDSLAADTDTLRAYTDCDIYFDYDDVLHVAFTVSGFFYYEGTITYTSMIYHWDEKSGYCTVIADGRFWNYTMPGAWHRVANRPSMVQDQDSRILYCVYEQLGMPGEFTDNGDNTVTPWDVSDDGFGCFEVMISASPGYEYYYNTIPGKMWTAPVNITDSRAAEGEYPNGMQAGHCQSEREPSVALNTEGDYLHIFYIMDTDAGFVIQEEGEFTNNPAVYHRVSKESIMDQIYANGEWVENYPLHTDSTGFYLD